jgi:acyl carrier protein
MLQQIIELMAECLERDILSVNGEDEFRNYDEWDSLAYLSVIAAIDDEYGLVVPIEEFRACRTVSALAAYVESHKE